MAKAGPTKRGKKSPRRRASHADRARESTARYRAKMKRQGMRLVQFWAPDTSAPGFEKELRRQVALLKGPDEDAVLEDNWQHLRRLEESGQLGDIPDYVLPGEGEE
jgi:hypothetical protein